MTPLEIYLATTIGGLIIDGTLAKWKRLEKYKGLFSWITTAAKIATRRK